MKKFIGIITAIALTFSCCATKNIPGGTTDITIINVRDSINFVDSVVYHHIYKEIYNDYTGLLDTLKLSTSYSDFKAFVDTSSNMLKGSAQNKEDSIPVKIKWKEKIVYRDSIRTVDKPYPVEVVKEVTKIPKSYWWFLGITILSGLYTALKTYLKFKL